MSLSDRLRKAQVSMPPPYRARPRLLLLPRVPKPLHGVAPRVVLGSKWWDETRRAAYASTGYRCAACGVGKQQATWCRWLEGHEIYDLDYLLGRAVYVETVPLCHACHNYIHAGRMLALLEKGEMRQEKYDCILAYGDRVLHEVGLVRPAPYEGPFADWGDWRMIIDGRKYPPKYKTFEAWLKEFG